jgi:hypothetical protein
LPAAAVCTDFVDAAANQVIDPIALYGGYTEVDNIADGVSALFSNIRAGRRN